jgi:23S rRNA pseudouridine1911/1915/1917 synthase
VSNEPEKEETILTFTVPPGYRHGDRLDVYLTQVMQNATRAKVQRGIREGRVHVNDAVVTRPSQVLQAGDEIVCRLLRPPPIEAAPEDIPLDIVYEDDFLIVLDKPAGMVVHPAYGNRTGTLVNALLHHVGAPTLRLGDADPDEDDDEVVGLSTATAQPVAEGDVDFRPGIVHRLDKDTSGLIVVARDDVTHARLAKQFVDRTIRRSYLAIVWGVPEPPSGRIETALGRDPRDRKKMAVVRPDRGKHAVTHFGLEEAHAHTALVRFQLETGRTHQIRVHARHIGHPILGDVTYGGQTIHYGPATNSRKAFFHNLFQRMPRQALHANTLGFNHPHTGEEMDFERDMPGDMRFVLDRLRQVEGVG